MALRAAVPRRPPVVHGKLSQWRAQPMVSRQLVTNVMMLAVGVASMG
jgi:hypothetical protein